MKDKGWFWGLILVILLAGISGAGGYVIGYQLGYSDGVSYYGTVTTQLSTSQSFTILELLKNNEVFEIEKYFIEKITHYEHNITDDHIAGIAASIEFMGPNDAAFVRRAHENIKQQIANKEELFR